MAKISVNISDSGISMEANYLPPGVLATLAGAAMVTPAMAGIEIHLGLGALFSFGGLIDLLFPIILPALGVLFILGGLMALGTAQVITYNRNKKTLVYESTIAFFWGSKKSHSTEGLECINYNLHKINHKVENYASGVGSQRNMLASSDIDVHTTWNASISLWYKSHNHGELAKISHSESLEEGLKMIAKELGINYERHVNEESRGGLI
jgi:hypothetical protein